MHMGGECIRALVLVLTLLSAGVSAQTVVVVDQEGEPIGGVLLQWTCSDTGAKEVFTTDIEGFDWPEKECANVEAVLSAFGFESDTVQVRRPAGRSSKVTLRLRPLRVGLSSAEVEETSDAPLSFMNSLEAGGVYRGIKSIVLSPSSQLAVDGESQTRNVFAALPGANVWESDAAGLQLGIGVRGMSPNRSAHLSMRQNGHPIAADPLGYPEAYYTPPIVFVDEVQWVSGASALQYGSQLGGMLNFNLRRGQWSQSSKVRALSSATAYAPRLGKMRGHVNVFAEASGGGDRHAWLVAFDQKQGDGWRDNASFRSATVTLTSRQRTQNRARGICVFEERFTALRRTEQQPGGVTDTQMANDPRRSDRDRNWFEVDWNIGSLDAMWLPERQDIDIQGAFHGLLASRKSLGFLGTPNRVDLGEERDLIWGDFASLGWDVRLTKRFLRQNSDRFSALVFGTQGYLGQNDMRQGPGVPGSDQAFAFDTSGPLRPESQFAFPNSQRAAFVQGIVALTEDFSITPGVRAENISTYADGTYREVIFDGAGNVIEDSLFESSNEKRRSVLLPGVGFSWKRPNGEWYANAVRNFRAVNFSDIQINNLGVVVDPNIDDERGSNVDLGYRTSRETWTLDVSAFVLLYQDRIGLVATTIPDPILVEKPVLLRTNLSDARTLGLECAGRRSWSVTPKSKTTLVGSFSAMHSRYAKGVLMSIEGNEVELVPKVIARFSLVHTRGLWTLQCLAQHVANQFTEATNSTYTATALHGLIPRHQVVDLGMQRKLAESGWSLGVKLNNALNAKYFTRRALAYPGPGILPADGINLRLTLRYSS